MRSTYAGVALGVAVALAFPAAALADSGSSSLSGGTGSSSLSGGGSKPSYSQWIADVTAVTTQAQSYLAAALPGVAKPAIVLDIDNTSLETSYNPSPIVPAIAPVLALTRYAEQHGAAIIFVTGRPSIMGIYTRANLSAVGYRVDGLYGGGLTTGSSGAGALESYKTGARIDIESKGYTIVANIGNSASDLAGGHAQATFKLPDYNGALN
ncbi:HAD family acid phosphatase [Nocardia acidivorans]|uniref:HAD family acid phosphatase n=1 Tax=Nocardia acidivorans TaxID=404580 RepID=UPI00082F7697|nr:HAD family acid phosphatase [Nocardia acidivorans]